MHSAQLSDSSNSRHRQNGRHPGEDHPPAPPLRLAIIKVRCHQKRVGGTASTIPLSEAKRLFHSTAKRCQHCSNRTDCEA